MKKNFLVMVLGLSMVLSTAVTAFATETVDQEERYYCVPACCKSVLRYVLGSAPTQRHIAEEIGTTSFGTVFRHALVYLNQHQPRVYGAKGSTTPAETMKSDFYNDIVSRDMPPMIAIKFEKETGAWQYSSDGHVVCLAGVRSDKGIFKIADPFINAYVDSSARKIYNMPFNKIYNAIHICGGGYFY